MKTAMITLAAVMSAASVQQADAQCVKTHNERHCSHCIKLYETTRWEQKEVVKCEQVLVGYSDQVTGYQDEIVGYEDVVVGYQDVLVRNEEVWVNKTVTTYETRTVYRRVVVGRDRCGNPIYRNRPVCEQVPVCRVQRVRECRPVYEKRPVIEKRPICRRKPVCENRPVYETREVKTCEWVQVPHAVFLCVR